MNAAVIFACVIGISQPAIAQSLFDGLGGADSATPLQKWRWTIGRQILERAPRLNLGRGHVVVNFHIDRAGHITDLSFESYSSNAHALVAASMISSLKLPPPPPGLGRDCCFFQQKIRFE